MCLFHHYVPHIWMDELVPSWEMCLSKIANEPKTSRPHTTGLVDRESTPIAVRAWLGPCKLWSLQKDCICKRVCCLRCISLWCVCVQCNIFVWNLRCLLFEVTLSLCRSRTPLNRNILFLIFKYYTKLNIISTEGLPVWLEARVVSSFRRCIHYLPAQFSNIQPWNFSVMLIYV